MARKNVSVGSGGVTDLGENICACMTYEIHANIHIRERQTERQTKTERGVSGQGNPPKEEH